MCPNIWNVWYIATFNPNSLAGLYTNILCPPTEYCHPEMIGGQKCVANISNYNPHIGEFRIWHGIGTAVPHGMCIPKRSPSH